MTGLSTECDLLTRSYVLIRFAHAYCTTEIHQHDHAYLKQQVVSYKISYKTRSAPYLISIHKFVFASSDSLLFVYNATCS